MDGRARRWTRPRRPSGPSGGRERVAAGVVPMGRSEGSTAALPAPPAGYPGGYPPFRGSLPPGEWRKRPPPTVRRAANGHLLPGGVLNPGGRPRNAIEEVRERLGPHTAEFCAALVELARSPNEATRLAAVREFFDRLIGKAPLAVDTTVTKVDIGQLYLQALKQANRPPAEAAIDVTPAPDAPAGVECNSTTEW
jgi:hypothetical protein